MRPAWPLLVALAAPLPAAAEPLVFHGHVEASQEAVLASRLNGVVAEILFRGGEAVEKGRVLIRLDPDDARLALAAAEARLARARAELALADSRAKRQDALNARGVLSDAASDPARAALAQAEAELALAVVERDRAALDLTRVEIRAPITGFVSRPLAALGAYVEAEAGAPLATIVALDPAIVVYDAPYAARLQALADSGAPTVEALLARVRLRLVLPGGGTYAATSTPDSSGATVDRATGAIAVRAAFPNPNALLRPGMEVTVLSEIGEPKP